MNEQKSAGYGYLWWIPRAGMWKILGMDEAAGLGMYEAAGFGGQRIAIWPKAGLVLVHRADTDANRTVPQPQILKLYRLIYEATIGRSGEDSVLAEQPDFVPLKT